LRRRNLVLNLECQHGVSMDSLPGPYGLVLTNLVHNAIVHAFPDAQAGTITLKAVASGPDNVEIIVSDDGCGMISEIRRRAFDPFFTTRRREGATGLGLPIVHSMVVDQLEGRLSLTSEPGRGTTVRLILPRSTRRDSG
jgi:signal transduction histidine kinase